MQAFQTDASWLFFQGANSLSLKDYDYDAACLMLEYLYGSNYWTQVRGSRVLEPSMASQACHLPGTFLLVNSLLETTC